MKIILNDMGENTLGSTRIHHTFLAEYLEKVGCSVYLNDWTNYCKYDICIFGKSTPYEQLVNAKQTAPNLIIGNTNPSSGSKEKIKKIEFSDFSIAGSLEERDTNLNLNRNIFLFPQIEILDLVTPTSGRSQLLLCYHGNKMHLDSLSIKFYKAFERIQNQFNIGFRCIYDINTLGLWRPKLHNLNIEHVQWELDNWTNKISECDIGIVPSLISIDGWRGKFAHFITSRNGFRSDYLIRFKSTTNSGRCFVFHQLKLPVIAEMVPCHFHILSNPDNGFLAYSEEGWYQALFKLCSSRELRETIAENAYNEFERQYDPLIWARRLVQEMDELRKGKVQA